MGTQRLVYRQCADGAISLLLIDGKKRQSSVLHAPNERKTSTLVDRSLVRCNPLFDIQVIAFEPVFDFCRDPAVTGNSRTHGVSAAFNTAGGDSARRARLADFLRPLLADAIEQYRRGEQLLKTAGTDDLDDETLDDDFDDDSYDAEVEDDLEGDLEDDATISTMNVDEDQIEEYVRELAETPSDGAQDVYTEIFYLVCDLAALADPESRDLIKTAFAEDMVESLIDEAYVERRYKNGGEPPEKLTDWLESYREAYRRKFIDPPKPSLKSRVFRCRGSNGNRAAPVTFARGGDRHDPKDGPRSRAQ